MQQPDWLSHQYDDWHHELSRTFGQLNLLSKHLDELNELYSNPEIIRQNRQLQKRCITQSRSLTKLIESVEHAQLLLFKAQPTDYFGVKSFGQCQELTCQIFLLRQSFSAIQLDFLQFVKFWF